MRKKIFVPLVLVPALLLFGCGSTGTTTVESSASQEATSAPESIQEGTPQSAGTFTALQRSDGWNYGGSGENGFYYVSSTVRDDGSTNLMYLDYATMQKIYLCGQPNCNHDTEACTSYLPYSAGGILSCVIGDHLVLIFPGNVYASADESETVLPHIEEMELDGADRKTTYTFEANQQINRPLVTDGTYIYCELDTVTDDGNLKAELIQVDPTAGTMDTICSLDQEWIKGCAGSRLILLDANGNYSAYDPIADERESIVTVENASVDSLLQGTTLAYKENGYFCLLDLLSGEKTTLDGFAVPSTEEAFANLVDVDSSHLLVQIETASHQTGATLEDGYYMVAGDAAPLKWNLLYHLGDDVVPFSRVTTLSDGKYLVIAGEEVVADANVGSYYMPKNEKKYIQMTQEDFWNGIEPVEASTQ